MNARAEEAAGSKAVVAVVQARMSSTRLPGKVLADLHGRPMLLRQVERVQRAAAVHTLVVATSEQPGDDPVADACAAAGIRVFRGSLTDVLDRCYQAVLPLDPGHVLRLTADCPLADPVVIDRTVALHLEERADYTSNTIERTYPDGLDVEVMRFECLQDARAMATDAFDREHVTPWLYRGGARRLELLRDREDRSHLRWVVDYPEDLAFVRAVYRELHDANPAFGADEVHDLLVRRPELADINASIGPAH